jgi:hypothetical protein
MGHRAVPSFGGYLRAFAAQFLHAGTDYSKVVGGARPDALAAQLLHAGTNHQKIVGGAGWGQCLPPVSCGSGVIYPAAATGSMRDGSLFLTLPTRALTGQHTMPSAG